MYTYRFTYDTHNIIYDHMNKINKLFRHFIYGYMLKIIINEFWEKLMIEDLNFSIKIKFYLFIIFLFDKNWIQILIDL